MVRVRSPGVLMIVTAYSLGLVIAAILVVALRMPAVGVSFVGEGPRVLAKTAAGQVISMLAPEVPVTLRGGGLRLVIGEAEVTGLLRLRGRACEHEQGNRWDEDEPDEPDQVHVFPPETNSRILSFEKIVTVCPLLSTWIVARAGVSP